MIKTIAVELVKKYKTNCPFTLARELNIHIAYESLGQTMGYYTKDFRIKFIHINQQLTDKDQAFTCAHELGHALLHPTLNTPFLRRHTLFSVDRIERQANTFAVELLLPDQLLEEYSECGFYNIADMVGIPVKLINLKR